MSLTLLKQLTITLLCSSILTACTLPLAKRPQPSPKSPSATALATSQLPPELPVVNPPPPGVPIPELPRTQPRALKEFNRVGEVPKISDLSDKTLSDKILSNLDEAAPIRLDFEQVSLRELIDIIGGEQGLKLNMVIDPSIGEKVTIRTAKDKPLRKQDLWPLLQLLLTEAGVTVEKKGNVYHFIKTGPSLPGIISVSPDALTGSEASEVLQISPLRYISVDTAIAVLTPLLQPKGRILSLPNVNVIGIITSPQRLERVNKLLAVIDADPFQHHGMRLFRLTNSKATEIQPELEKIFQALSGRTPPAYVSIPLDRINSLLVIAPPGGSFDDVATWVEILDGRSEESGEQIFIYRVKNLEAAKLAGTLSSVFKTAEQRKEDERLKRLQQQEKEKNPNLPGEPIPPPQPVLPPGAKTPGGALAVSAELKVNIVADESTNSLLIRANPRDYRQLLETIYALDQIPKEVMINVVIAEVTLTEATQFGIDWTVLLGKARYDANGKPLLPRSFMSIDYNIPDSSQQLKGFAIEHITGGLTAVLNLVASTNDLSILSRPSLLVRNNEEATMNVGSNEPFLGAINSSTLNNQQVSQDVQYKDTGITLKVTPRINDDGVINMKIEQELSQIGPTRTTQNLQSFIQRKVTTSVVVRDGSAIIIGGLIQTNRKNDQQGIPVLRDLPVVGDTLFSSTDKNETRTELVLIMVPTVVSPELDNSQLMQDFRQRIKMVSDLLNEQELGYFLPPPAPPVPPTPTLRQDKPVSSSPKKK